MPENVQMFMYIDEGMSNEEKWLALLVFSRLQSSLTEISFAVLPKLQFGKKRRSPPHKKYISLVWISIDYSTIELDFICMIAVVVVFVVAGKRIWMKFNVRFKIYELHFLVSWISLDWI